MQLQAAQVMTYPMSDITIGSIPVRDLVTCGTCGKMYPDIYPAGRCPWEYDHAPDPEPPPLVMQAAFLPANNAWVVLWGRTVKDSHPMEIDGQVLFSERRALRDALKRHGLKMDHRGIITPDGPNPFDQNGA